jgi:hypothetical protein
MKLWFECFVCVFACILASSRITRSGSWKTDPSFQGGFCHTVINRSLTFPHCFIDCCGREAGYGPVDWLAVVLWIVSGALLLGGSGSVQIYWRLCKRLLCTDCMRYVWSETIRRLSMGCVWLVGRVSPVMCTSIWISATLGYEYRLFVAVIT